MLLWAALGILAPAQTSADADVLRRIGVVVAAQVNLSAEEARNLATQVGAALGESLPVDVIAGVEAERRLPEDGLPDDCTTIAECRQDLGRRLDVDELLFLVIVRIGGDTQIDTTWASVASGHVTSRPAITIASDSAESARDRFKRFAPALLPHIAKRAKTGSDKPPVIMLSTTGWDSGRRMTTGTWIATGVAAGGLLGGTIYGLLAQRKLSALEKQGCTETSPCEGPQIDALERDAVLADIFFAAALASGVTAAVLYWRSDRGEPPTIQVGTGPSGSVGLSLGGWF